MQPLFNSPAAGTTKQPIRWNSGDKTIHRSVHHHDLYIINHADGSFHTVSSSYDLMIRKYPTDVKRSKKISAQLR